MINAVNNAHINKPLSVSKAIQHPTGKPQRSPNSFQSTCKFNEILSTNWKLYELDRNAGFMRPGTKLELLLTVLSRTPFKEKLQIMYGKLLDPDAPLEVAWKQLKKSGHRIQKETVLLCLKDEEED